MLIIGVLLMFYGVMELFVIERTRSWKLGGVSLLAGAILVAVSVLVERFILGV
jgi:hypothetical protein